MDIKATLRIRRGISKTIFINYNSRELMDDKYGCYLFLKEFTDKATPVYGIIDNGELFFLNPYSNESELFNSEKKFILKPRKGRGGFGVCLLERKDDGFYLNGKFTSHLLKDVYKTMKNYIINPYIQQHSYSSTIFPHSVNTIRLLSCVQDGKVRIMRAAHRFGLESTGCVDNVSSGGVIALIDVATGIIENATYWEVKNYRKSIVELHPETGQRIGGVQIPNWKEMIDGMVKLHESIKFIRYVGWDIAMTPTSYQIIEANYASGLESLQLKTPLLLEEENKRFFSHWN